MKKRFVSCLLSIVMIITFIPYIVVQASTENELIQKFKNTYSDTIIKTYYNDFDNDGINEMFVFAGKSYDDEGMQMTLLGGGVWFVSDNIIERIDNGNNGIGIILSRDDYAPSYINYDNGMQFAFQAIWGNGQTRTTVCTVKNGNVIKSGFEGSLMNGENGWYVATSTYDGMISKDNFNKGLFYGSQRSWKNYWYYFDNTSNTFKEYGGTEITKEQFLQFDGAEDILNEITDGEIYNILYRDNSIININIIRNNGLFSDNDSYRCSNILVGYDDNSVWKIDDNDGIYLPALDSTIATYPKFKEPDSTDNSVESDEQYKERGFDITRDGWPFRNNFDGFGYLTDDGKSDENYKFPTRIWTNVYGESVNTYIKARESETWGGNCFGMCSTAYLYYMEQLDSIGEINEIGYDDIRSDGWEFDSNGILGLSKKRYPALYKDSVINSLISEYQVACGSEEFRKIRNQYQFTSDGSYREMFKRVIEYLQNTKHTLCLEVFWGYDKESKGYSSGHALMVDCSHNPVVEKIDDNWRKIYLYDPNYPHYDNDGNLDLPKYYEKWDERYLTVNISTGEWYYCGSVNGDAQEYELHNGSGKKINAGDDAMLYFYDLEGIPNNFNNKLHFMPEDNRFKYYIAATDFSLANDNKILFEVNNGKITKRDNSVNFIPYIGDITNNNKIRGDIYLPVDDYTIKVKGENNIISLSNDKVNSVNMSEGSIKMETSLKNDEMKISSSQDSDVEILSSNIYDTDTYDYIFLEGQLSKDENIVIAQKGKDEYNIESNAKKNFNIEHKNNAREEKIQDTSLLEWDGTYTKNNSNNKNENNSSQITQSQINNKSDYSDVNSTDSYFNAINLLSELDIINGYNDGTFKPDNKVTRAEFTKLVVATLGDEELAQAERAAGYDTEFSDVPGKHWASGYITSGVYSGLINGMGDGTFAPNANVTYAQAMKILVCAAGYEQWATDAGGWPDGYLKYANEAGIGAGIQASNDTAITRGQVAQMIYNAIQAPVVVVKDFNSKDSKGNALPTLEKRDGIGSNYQSILTLRHDIYVVEGYMKNEDGFVITSSKNFDDEYYPENSKKTIEIYYTPYDEDEDSNKQVTAFIECDEDDDYNVIYMY